MAISLKGRVVGFGRQGAVARIEGQGLDAAHGCIGNQPRDLDESARRSGRYQRG